MNRQGAEMLHKSREEKCERNFCFLLNSLYFAAAACVPVCAASQPVDFWNWQVKTGIQLDSDLTNKDRLAEAVFELSTAAPKCLTGVSPAPRTPLPSPQPRLH